ncbi:ATP-binding protein [Marichromatium gracile]|uniref:ATP-binding protein n=1 Tax=Marichromatium gracile TaxID=1048 RepID=UPI001290679F|nr:ATP-binding protein [Marichromatium gracile]
MSENLDAFAGGDGQDRLYPRRRARDGAVGTRPAPCRSWSSAGAIAAGGRRLSTEVEDRGRGIDSALAADIFEAFRRGDPSRSRKNGGSGLGLAVVKAIAEAHGGHAEYQPSSLGRRSLVISWPMRVHR